jgi:hypothetical protein
MDCRFRDVNIALVQNGPDMRSSGSILFDNVNRSRLWTWEDAKVVSLVPHLPHESDPKRGRCRIRSGGRSRSTPDVDVGLVMIPPGLTGAGRSGWLDPAAVACGTPDNGDPNLASDPGRVHTQMGPP